MNVDRILERVVGPLLMAATYIGLYWAGTVTA